MKKINVDVLPGNISTASVDGYVVPQFADTFSLTGVSGTFLKSSSYRAMLDYGKLTGINSLPLGGAVITKTEKCRGRFINVVALGLTKEESFKSIQLATYAALVEAEKNKFTTIAMPALGTGESGHLTFWESANAMLSAISVFSSKGVLQKIEIYVLHGIEAYTAFLQVVGNKTYLRYVEKGLPGEFKAIMQATKKCNLNLRNEDKS